MQALKALSKKIAIMNGIEAVLNWDQETYMPEGSNHSRAEQMQLMAGLRHEAKTSQEFKKALGALIDLESGKILKTGLSDKEQAALREWLVDFKKATALPQEFVERFSLLTSHANQTWKEARKTNKFEIFAADLEKIVEMSQERAKLLGYKDHPYDALLNDYEPGLTTAHVEAVFDEVQKKLTPLLKKAPSKHKPFKKEMGDKEQLELSHNLLNKMGYDIHHGRLDLSTHPFSTAPHPTDSRITTRIAHDLPLSNILTTMHEAGHALYEMGLPEEEWGTPLGEAISLGIHESQSRFWETRIGLSKPFWEMMAPIFNSDADTLYHSLNRIEPSFIRVEADEVTYPLHVILRFRLEKRLIEGTLKVKDLPAAWNEEMTKLLGITPPTDTLGCLQDVHWSMGAFGYFPTYLLGTMYASHLFEAFAKDFPDWETRVKKGELIFIKEWLNNKIHKHGRRYSPLEMIKQASGKEFSSAAFTHYLEQKYHA